MKIISKNLILSLFIIFIFNITFFCISLWTETMRSIVNIDYFLVLIFLFFKRKILCICFFLIISFIDFINIFFQIFPIIRLENLFYLLKFSLLSTNIYKFFGFAVLIVIFIQILLIQKIYKEKQNLNLIIIFNIFVFILLGKNIFSKIEDNLFLEKINYIVYSGLDDYMKSRNGLFMELFEKKGPAFQKIKGEKIYFDESHKKILFIINESWGVPYDKNIQKEIIKPILDLKRKRLENIILDNKKFSGFTLSAELRELCHLIPLHYNLKNQNIGFEECIPNLMKKSGYKTISVHGALGLMYDREYWYPRAGFSESLFQDSGLNLPNSRCFSFPGNCDRDIAMRVIEQFKKNDKIFLYWLTLNTHAVYDKRDLKKDDFKCNIFNIIEDSEVCRNLKLQRQFFSILADVVSSPALNGSKVIIVGDHIPPLFQKQNNIFVDGVVPKIEFNINPN